MVISSAVIPEPSLSQLYLDLHVLVPSSLLSGNESEMSMQPVKHI